VVRARPPHNYPCRWQNLVRTNFSASNEHLKIKNLAKSCEAKGEAGEKKENFQRVEVKYMLSISSLFVNN